MVSSEPIPIHYLLHCASSASQEMQAQSALAQHTTHNTKECALDTDEDPELLSRVKEVEAALMSP